MKYAHPEIGTVFDFDNGKINALVIENPDFFCKLLTDFYSQLCGADGEGIVSLSDTPVDMAKYVELLDVFVPFELNRKSLLTKITAALEKNATEPEHYEETMRFLRDAEVYFDKIAFDFPCDIVFPKLSSIGALLKSAAPELRDDSSDLCEKLLDYFELVREFDRDKLFILVNFRSYVSDDKFELFAQSVLSHGYRVFLIESSERKRASTENRLLIDKDLCEIG